MWAVFVYASNKSKERAEQWEGLSKKKSQWGENWILGGDFNEIRHPLEKQGGRVRHEDSCKAFQDFIQKMNMEEVEVQGRQSTWANNWKEEGYIEARLDRFFGAVQWLLANGKAIVKHVDRYASDHCMLLLDTKPEMRKKKKRFYFDRRWVNKYGIEDTIQTAWEMDCIGPQCSK